MLQQCVAAMCQSVLQERRREQLRRTGWGRQTGKAEERVQRGKEGRHERGKEGRKRGWVRGWGKTSGGGSVLQYVAVCYSVLQCVAVCCSVACVAVCCSVLQCVAV